MKPEQYMERQVEVAGWPLRLTSYRLGKEFRCKADNVSPGAWLARSSAPTREEAEAKALELAKVLLLRTHRHGGLGAP